MKDYCPISPATGTLALALAVLVAAIMYLCAGCKTQSADGAYLNLAAAVARNATAIAVTADLQAKPEHRQAYQVAEVVLSKFMADGTYAPEKLQAALSALPIGKLDGEQGALVLLGAVSVFDAASATLFDVESAPAVKRVGQAVLDGLRVGLAAPATRSVRQVPVVLNYRQQISI